MWQQTTELFLAFNKEFSQDECSPNVDSDFSGGEEIIGYFFSLVLFLVSSSSFFFNNGMMLLVIIIKSYQEPRPRRAQNPVQRRSAQ